MKACINSYTPRGNRTFWVEAGPIVRDIVTQLEPAAVGTAKGLLNRITYLARWVDSVGLPISVETLFDSSTLRRYVASQDLNPLAQEDLERRLRGYGQRLGRPQAQALRPSLRETVKPYTRREITAFTLWARTRSTAFKRRHATVLFALALGAGLKRREIVQTRPSSFTDRDGILYVEASGRKVPIFHAQAALLREVLPTIPGDEPLDPTSRPATGGYLKGPRSGPHTERLRATWIVAHLQAGTPLKELQAASGLDIRTPLTRYLAHVRDTDGASQRMAEVKPGL